MIVYVLIERCCRHFNGLFISQDEAMAYIDCSTMEQVYQCGYDIEEWDMSK